MYSLVQYVLVIVLKVTLLCKIVYHNPCLGIKVENFCQEVLNPQFLITGGLRYCFSFISRVLGTKICFSAPFSHLSRAFPLKRRSRILLSQHFEEI